MDQHKQYLAANVLNEGKIVNYRLLSRAVKVHSTVAKQMLFEFHKTQNAKTPKSIHATYLITGCKKPVITTNGVHDKDGEDVSMTSSPPFSSFRRSESGQQEEEAPVSVTTVMLVKEEDLEEIQGQYEEIQTIFIYSLEPGPIQDLQLLSECNRRVAKEYASEDPLAEWKKYGVIQNPNVKRRTTRRPPPAATSTSTSTPTSSKSAPPKKEDSKDSKSSFFPSTKPKSTAEPAKKAESKSSTVRRDSSNISSMFANAKSKPKTKSGAPSTASPANAASPAEDSPMKDVEDDEAGNDDDFVVVDDGKTEAAKKARKDREEKLRAMMDEDEDEEMADVDSARPEPAAEMEQEAEVDDSGALDAQSKPKDDEKKEEAKVEGGRRRGRRKVMKKRTTKDEDGFLVTTEEAVWESFSEEEPEPKKAKVQPSSFGAAKGGKKAAKGQGNIMNFFKKG